MKPKTKLQNRVAELSKELWYISKEQKEWAYKTCLEHRAYATKNRVLCLDCGETFSPQLVSRKKAICPNCSTKVQVKDSRNTTDKQINYFAITEIMEEFQVIRNFEIIAQYKKGNPVNYYLHEILQYWVQPDGKTTMFGKSHNSNWCMDSWSGSMEIRQETKRWGGNKYDVYPRFYYPKSEFKKEYLKYGINHNLKGLSFLEAIQVVPNNPHIETLLKAKQYALAGQGNSYRIRTYWDSIKICLRNKYYVKDAIIWIDYMELLKYFKKDLRNAKYVCPKDLMKEHDRLMKKKREILRLQEIEQERLKVIKRQENLEKAIVEYVERNRKFFDLEFTKDNITVKLLQSVEEFKQEGDELKHCVFTNEYYSRQNSLVFSARVEGKRTETIEVSLDDMKISQSRGLNNKSTEHHNKIVDLVSKNLWHIRKIAIQNKKNSNHFQKIAV
jgi:hypothetical protein